MKGALLVAGTGSDVGKSVLVQGICRWLTRAGVRVSPFKAQNMSLNSFVTRDGAEIARAQYAQSLAAGVDAEASMNPVLIKPIDDTRSQVIVLGRAMCDTDASEYMELRPRLAGVVGDALTDLRTRFDVVICEGAGSLAEMNLREGDIANMGLARAAGLPVVVVGDIDRGGVFASLRGSLELLDPQDQSLVSGFIINKFRGDAALLEPGLRTIEAMTGRPVLGVVPWVRGFWPDAEDALAANAIRINGRPPAGRDAIDVAVVALGRMSNFTDMDPLVCEPGVSVRFTRAHGDLMRADLVVVPGTKATVSDLANLRADGLDRTLVDRARRGRPILGICGGYQILGTKIMDPIESGENVEGLGLLPIETLFETDKILARPGGTAPTFDDARVDGYEIHHGRVRRLGGEPLFRTIESDEGCVSGSVLGTSWHGIFESDDFRAAFLGRLALTAGLDWHPTGTNFESVREDTFELLADLVERSIDTAALMSTIAATAPSSRSLGRAWK